MIARLGPGARFAIDLDTSAARQKVVTHEDVVDAQALILLERTRPVIPPRVVATVGVFGAEEVGERVVLHHLPMSAMRKLVKDYLMICDSYNNAIRSAAPSQIEAIDMGRRGLHNEAGEVLMETLAGKIEIDLETGRRLFTLVCALHVRA